MTKGKRPKLLRIETQPATTPALPRTARTLALARLLADIGRKIPAAA